MPVTASRALQRSRFVVEAAMQHAAVVSGLVLADGTFFFEHADPGAGKPLAQPVSGGQSNDAAADDGNLFRVHEDTSVYAGTAAEAPVYMRMK